MKPKLAMKKRGVARVEAKRDEVPPNACRGERCGVWGRRAPIKLVGVEPEVTDAAGTFSTRTRSK